jgi:hypothetical protein
MLCRNSASETVLIMGQAVLAASLTLEQVGGSRDWRLKKEAEFDVFLLVVIQIVHSAG